MYFFELTFVKKIHVKMVELVFKMAIHIFVIAAVNLTVKIVKFKILYQRIQLWKVYFWVHFVHKILVKMVVVAMKMKIHIIAPAEMVLMVIIVNKVSLVFSF